MGICGGCPGHAAVWTYYYFALVSLFHQQGTTNEGRFHLSALVTGGTPVPASFFFTRK